MDNETAKHTPGPWEFNRFGDLTIRANNWGVIAKIAKHDARLEFAPIVLANARLLTAAPELLEACKLAVDYFSRLPQHADRGHDIANDSAILNAAIAQAEGTADAT